MAKYYEKNLRISNSSVHGYSSEMPPSGSTFSLRHALNDPVLDETVSIGRLVEGMDELRHERGIILKKYMDRHGLS